MRHALDFRSLLLGAALCAIILGTVGAATNRLSGHEVLPVRFKVVEVRDPDVEWQHGGSVRLLTLKPWYGKISKKSEDWRLENETQSLSLVAILMEEGYQINKGDILGFRLDQHLKTKD